MRIVPRPASSILSVLMLVMLPSLLLGQLETRKLSNGLTVAFEQDSTRNLMHLGLTVRAGALADPPEADGLAQLFGQLLLNRKDSLEGLGHIEEFVATKGLLRFQSTEMECNFFALSIDQKLAPAALHMLSATISKPKVDLVRLVEARPAVAADIQEAQSEPGFFLMEGINRKLWGDHFYRKNLFGDYGQLISVGATELTEMMQRYLRPQFCLISGTGDMRPESFFQLVDSLFGSWETGSVFSNAADFEPAKLENSHYFHNINAFAEQPMIAIAWPMPGARKEPKLVRWAEVFAAYGSLKGGAFHEAVVGEGLARDLQWTYGRTFAPGQMILTVFPDPDSIEQCLRAVFQEMEGMKGKSYYSGEDLKAARRVMELRDAGRDDGSWSRLRSQGIAWATNFTDWPQSLPASGGNARLAELAGYLGAGNAHVAGLLLNSELSSHMKPDSCFHLPFLVVTSPSTASDSEPGPGPSVIPGLNRPAPIDSISRELREFRIHFESSSFIPDRPSMRVIAEAASMLHRFSGYRLQLNGYADAQGDGVYNYKLSIQRAEAVRDIFINLHGVNPDRLAIRGWGEAFPEYPNDTPQNMARNRRVTIDLIRGK